MGWHVTAHVFSVVVVLVDGFMRVHVVVLSSWEVHR